MWAKNSSILFASLYNLSANLSNACTCCFSDSVIISFTLHDIILADGFSVPANDFFSFVPKNLAPRFNAVNSYTFGNVVSVQTHTGDHLGVKLIHQFLVVIQRFVKRS